VISESSGLPNFSFEPNPFLYESLRTLFATRANVKCWPFAFSDRDGYVMLAIPRGKSLGVSIRVSITSSELLIYRRAAASECCLSWRPHLNRYTS